MTIEVIKGDITKVTVDIIVNAANSSLLGGSGVDGAIHKAGGSQILEDCKKIIAKQGGSPTGEAVITSAGKLPCKYVIHTVGPVWNSGKLNEPELLKRCYENSLKLAEEYKAESIAFPNISTGIYGYPKEKALKVVVKVMKSFSFSFIKKVVFVNFDDENYELYRKSFDF